MKSWLRNELLIYKKTGGSYVSWLLRFLPQAGGLAVSSK